MDDKFYTKRNNMQLITEWIEPQQNASLPNGYVPIPNMKIQICEERDYSEFQPVQMIRIPFCIDKAVARVQILITSHGVYQLRLNGRKIGNSELTPGVSPYNQVLMYQTYDITGSILCGKNVFAILLGDGWWKGQVGLFSANCEYGNMLGLWMQCEIFYVDGQKKIFGGENGCSLASNIIYSDLFMGECYDASREIEGWDTPCFDDTQWLAVKEVYYSKKNLYPQEGDGIQVVDSFPPKKLMVAPNGDWVLDVGKNIAGWVEIQIEAPKGCRIILEHSETLDADGNFMYSVAGPNKDQRDIYITKEGWQKWHPLFTYHGFRYVRIKGWPGTPKQNQLQISVLSTPIERCGHFVCSDIRLNQLHENIWNSQVANMMSIPTDCPQREKAGWTGDMVLYAPTMLRLSNGSAFLKRWLWYCRMEQRSDGQIPIVVPYWKSYQKYCEYKGFVSSSGWGDAIIFVPWDIYRSTGDKEVLRENYEAMKKWLLYVQKCAETEFVTGFEQFPEYRKERHKYLWNTGFHYGDWLLPSIMMQKGAVPMDTAEATKEVVASAYYGESTKILAKIADILGNKEDAEHYSQLYASIKKAFSEEYIHSDGSMACEYQGAYVLAISFGLAPEGLVPKLVNHLCTMITRNNNCLDTGFMSVRYLLEVLENNGHEDDAYALLFQDRCPSWLYMVENGATSIWESWNCIDIDGKPGAFSYNHYALGCVGEFLYSNVVGIKAMEPGYRRVIIKPGINSGLTFLEASQYTPYGSISVYWKLQEKKLYIKLKIPKKVTAEIVIPNTTLNIQLGRAFTQISLYIVVDLEEETYKIEEINTM